MEVIKIALNRLAWMLAGIGAISLMFCLGLIKVVEISL